MRAPAHDPRHGEKRGIDLARDANQVVDEARVEVHVGAERLVAAFDLIDRLDGDLLDALHEFELLQAAFLDGQVPGHFLQQDGARVGFRVDRVADAVDEAAAVERRAGKQPAHAGGDLVFVLPVADLLLHEGDHVADLEVRATMLGPFQGADAGGDGRERVRARGRSHADREGGVVTAAVLGVEDQ